MFSSEQPQSGHHMRFYIVMATLVIGGIFFFLLMNNNGGSFTSTVGKAIDGTVLSNGADNGSASSETVASVSSARSVSKDAHQVAVKLEVDQIPSFSRKVTVSDISVKFRAVDNQISVNNDRLELHNLNTVQLKVSGFDGQVNLDATGLGLEGSARRIEVNGVVLASAKDIKISFGKIAYDSATLDQIVLSDITVGNADGDITVSDRLNYKLQGESVGLYNVAGSLTVDQAGTASSEFEGTARGIDLNGAALSLEVR